MMKTTRVTDIKVYQDILGTLDSRRKMLKYDSPASRVLRKYVKFLIEVGSPLSYSNYNTTLRNCLIEINQCIKSDNGYVKRKESNLLQDLERELKKPHQAIIEEEI